MDTYCEPLSLWWISVAALRLMRVQRLLQRVERKTRAHRTAGSPAHDSPVKTRR